MPTTACTLRDDPGCRTAALQFLSAARAHGLDVARIRSALRMAAHGHAGQRRRSGEPFIAHPLAVAGAAVQLRASTIDVVTGLVHDMLEDCRGVTIEALLHSCGEQVVGGLLALTKRADLPKPQRVAEAHGRLVDALHHHGPGLALVKLLDRAHNAATSAVLPPERLQRLQAENHALFAPLARRVGADGLAAFLLAEPPRWWQAAEDFPMQMRSIQPPLPCGA